MLRTVALDATLIGRENTGDSTYWRGLANHLSHVADDGWRFLLLSDSEPPQNVPANMKWVQLRRRKKRWFSAVTLPLAARRLGASIYHTQYTLSPLARRGITTVHDVSFFIEPSWFRAQDAMLLRRFVPGSCRRAAAVITVSETSKRDLLRFISIGAEKVFVTYNGVDERFRPTDDGEVLQKHGLIAGEYLLSVGTRWPRKNMSLAVKAAGQAGWPLALVGKSGWGEDNSGSAKSLGYVADEELPALYSGAKIYLMPSHYEGFGIPMLEAFACGTPVISSAGGALPEVSGGAAVCLDDMTPKAWSAKIVELAVDSSKLQQMRADGIERAKAFSWDLTAAKTLEVYKQVLR